jgi:hypothetical protein
MTRHDPVDFRLFLILWNQVQGQETPAVHLRIADWLQARWVAGDTRLLLMAFRSCGKSTITGIFTAWLFYANPDIRILVLAAESMLARRMVRNARRMIERHPLTAHLKPARADQWAGDRFTINRGLELRDPSMLGQGVMSNITGSRADVIICDDVEVPNTCETAEKRLTLRERLGELEYVLVPGGTLLYVGTPHHWFTIYADQPRHETGETQCFLDGYKRLKLPIIGADGRSAWPERYGEGDIARMKRQTGINKFTSQMMLEPVNAMEGRLDPARLRRYSGELIFTKELDILAIDGNRMASCSAFWDPAFGGNDGSVVAVVFTDEKGDLWLHRVAYLRAGSNINEAEAQCQQVAILARTNFVPLVTVEINGIGKFLPPILRREMGRARTPCAVAKHTSTRRKDIRILEAFETIMAAGMLHVHESVFHTPFLTEMREWRPGRSRGHDDGLDAVAGALELQPVRLKAEGFAGRQGWQGGKTHMAETGFEVV